MENDLMTPQEVASLFRVNLPTVRRYGEQGLIERVQLPLVGSHRQFRYRRTSVEWWTKTMQARNGKPKDER